MSAFAEKLQEGDELFEWLADHDDLDDWLQVVAWHDDVLPLLDDQQRREFDFHAPAPPFDPTYTPQRRALWQYLTQLHKIAGE